MGELFKPEYLRKRVENVEEAFKERGGGCANLYTNLGRGAREGYGITASLAGKERTFCNLPVFVTRDGKEVRTDGGGFRWAKAVNDKASDETTAHMSMFFPRDNPGFYALGEKAKECLTSWIDQGWYQASHGLTFLGKDHGVTFGEVGDGWEKPDYDTEEVRAKERERDRYGAAYPADADLAKDWDSVAKYGEDSDVENDVRMRDDGHDDEDLADSVIVDKAAQGDVPLPRSRGDTGL